ncbi:TPA: hypothetical protein ACUB6H_003498 [Enterobacter cloacae]|uniref:hypothetical protein n=1 Tax=Enterobacter cloacae complex sp. I1M TaxID=2779604 RepID=UPI00187674D9|nr:hypothetical protein [Enterobacter cloacae complex sp. I1M]MBE4923667.1 hypothetical protein [Enterobacter cloacae complex sp. I1M]
MKESYFDPDLEPEDSALPEVNAIPANELDTPSDTAAAKEVPAAAKWGLWGYDLKTLLLAGAAVIALLAYAFWPDEPPARALIPDSPASAQQEAKTEQDLHTSGKQDEELNSASPDGIPEPMPSRSLAEDPDRELIGLTGSVDNKEVSELKEYGEANRQAITLLNDRVKDSEKRLADIEAKLNTLSTKQALAPQKAPTSTTAHRVKNVSTAGSSGLKGWRINTVYPGMAWITHNGSTWSVQPGDKVNGLTIRSIDAERRIVVTSKGVIRQGD